MVCKVFQVVLGEELCLNRRLLACANPAVDANLLVEIIDLPDKDLRLLLGALAIILVSEAAVVSYLRITLERNRIQVLRECGDLDRIVDRIVPDDVGKHYRVGKTVRDVVLLAKLVGAGVADSQECVGESNASNRCSLVHVATSNRAPPDNGALEVIEDHLDGLEGERHRVLSGHRGHIGLDCMGQGVDTRPSRKRRGNGQDKLWIDDSHVCHELIVCKRILDVLLLVSNDSKWRHLRTGARGRWDCNTESLHRAEVQTLGIFVDALADVHETLRKPSEVDLRMLVEEPDHLGQIHSGAATEGDDRVWLEVLDLCKAPVACTKVGVRKNVCKYLYSDVACGKRPNYLIGKPKVVHGLARDDVGSREPARDEVCGSLFQRPLADVHHLWHLEPERVAPHNGHLLVVEQVLRADVLGDRVLAIRAAADGHRRVEVKVVEIANAPECAGRIDDYAASTNVVCEVVDAVASVGRGVDCGCVACASHVNHLPADIDGLLECLCPANAQDGRKLLAGHCLVGAHLGEGADYAAALAISRDSDTRLLSDLACRTADNVGVELVLPGLLADGHDQLVDTLLLVFRHNVCPTEPELFDALVVDLLGNADDGLLGGTDDAVVERLAVDDLVHSGPVVASLVNERGDVAGADTDGRVAGGVGRGDHARPAGGKDAACLGVSHEGLRQRDGGLRDPGNAVGRSPSPDGGVTDNACRVNSRLYGPMVRREDDAIPRLECNEALEDSSRRRIRGGDNASQNAERICNSDCVARLVLLDDANGLHVLVLIVHILRPEHVLNNLVLDDTHACLLVCHLCKGDALVRGRKGCSVEDLIHLRLIELVERVGCLLHFLKEGVEVLGRLNELLAVVKVRQRHWELKLRVSNYTKMILLYMHRRRKVRPSSSVNSCFGTVNASSTIVTFT